MAVAFDAVADAGRSAAAEDLALRRGEGRGRGLQSPSGGPPGDPPGGGTCPSRLGAAARGRRPNVRPPSTTSASTCRGGEPARTPPRGLGWARAGRG